MRRYIILGAVLASTVLYSIAALSPTDMETFVDLFHWRFNTVSESQASTTFSIRTGIVPSFSAWQLKDTTKPFDVFELTMQDTTFAYSLSTNATTMYSLAVYYQMGHGGNWRPRVFIDSCKRFGTTGAKPAGAATLYGKVMGTTTGLDSIIIGRQLWWLKHLAHNAGCDKIRFIIDIDSANCQPSTSTFNFGVIRKKDR